MFISVFEIFKVGIGPSSSHTIGPMVAANKFRTLLAKCEQAKSVGVTLFSSLAFTGKGHGTDWAVSLGLMGFEPETFDDEAGEAALKKIHQDHRLSLPGNKSVTFDPANDIAFDFDTSTSLHPNEVRFTAFDEKGAEILSQTYFSIGGGFIKTKEDLSEKSEPSSKPRENIPYPYASAKDVLDLGEKAGLSIAAMALENEHKAHPGRDIEGDLLHIWRVMEGCIERGLVAEGELPGGLNVKRRAKSLHTNLQDQRLKNETYPDAGSEWLALYAMAVNEENAARGKVVTAPTNGAAGVVPSVIKYHLSQCRGEEADIAPFLLTAGIIGSLIKQNASISGAECGCQAEVGAASAMAAAGLCAVRGGTNMQIENAAEIALEHHLGMTCDPVKGLVQVPCIERNGVGAVKAVLAASLALQSDGEHIIPLDNCIESMLQTGLDMRSKYKETSLGGLAVNIPEC